MSTENILANPRIAVTTLQEWVKKQVEPIWRQSVVFGMMQKRGKVAYNKHGKWVEWPIKFTINDIEASSGDDDIDFASKLKWQWAKLPWRHYRLGIKLTELEKRMNGGAAALISLIQDYTKDAIPEFMARLKQKIYIDGVTNTKDWHGLESIFSYSGLVTNGVVGNPNGTYGGLNQALGTYETDWTPGTGLGWPTGSGDYGYGAVSPMIYDYNNTDWTATTKSWANTFQEVINHAMTYQLKLYGTTPDIWVLDSELLRQAKTHLEGHETFEATQRSEVTDLGFKTLSYLGTEFVSEYGVPEGVGYGLTFDGIELWVLDSNQLVDVETDRDMPKLTDIKALYTFSNMCFKSPAQQVKLVGISTAGT